MEVLDSNISYGIINNGQSNIVCVNNVINKQVLFYESRRYEIAPSEIQQIPATATNSDCLQQLYPNFSLRMRC